MKPIKSQEVLKDLDIDFRKQIGEFNEYAILHHIIHLNASRSRPDFSEYITVYTSLGGTWYEKNY